MSPPPARIVLMFCWSTPPVSGRVLSQRGVQPPPESMNAIVNHRTPVAFMTVDALGGLPQPRYRYGAAFELPAASAVELSTTVAVAAIAVTHTAASKLRRLARIRSS